MVSDVVLGHGARPSGNVVQIQNHFRPDFNDSPGLPPFTITLVDAKPKSGR